MTDEEETDSESESEKAPPAKKPKIDDEGSKSESVRDPDIRYKPPSYLELIYYIQRPLLAKQGIIFFIRV